MQNQFKLLVIEHEQREIERFRDVLYGELPRWPIGVMDIYAVDLAHALDLLPHADGVITNIFFPTLDGGDGNAPNGQIILKECLRLKKPAVWTTQTSRMKQTTLPSSEWGRNHGYEVFDPRDAEDNTDGNIPWAHALYGLVITAVGLETGDIFFSSDGQILQTMGPPSRVTPIPFGGRCFSLAHDWITPEITSDRLLNEPILNAMLKMGFMRR